LTRKTPRCHREIVINSTRLCHELWLMRAMILLSPIQNSPQYPHPDHNCPTPNYVETSVISISLPFQWTPGSNEFISCCAFVIHHCSEHRIQSTAIRRRKLLRHNRVMHILARGRSRVTNDNDQ